MSLNDICSSKTIQYHQIPDLGLVPEEHLHHVCVAVFGGEVQCRVADLVFGVHVGACAGRGEVL